MPVGRLDAYHKSQPQIAVLPRPLAEPPPERQPQSRAEAFAGAARPLTNRVPDGQLRSTSVGQRVVERSLIHDPFEAYAAQRRETARERETTDVRAEVSSAAGGALQSIGSLLDVKV